jgi:hypothetical protein
VLWQNAKADIHRQCVAGEGENFSGVTPVRIHCLSDEVLSYTLFMTSRLLNVLPVIGIAEILFWIAVVFFAAEDDFHKSA